MTWAVPSILQPTDLPIPAHCLFDLVAPLPPPLLRLAHAVQAPSGKSLDGRRRPSELCWFFLVVSHHRMAGDSFALIEKPYLSMRAVLTILV